MTVSASKDKKRGTWKVYIRYEDWKGQKQIHTKRGFSTKREALEYEREFLAKRSKELDMNFSDFTAIYLENMKPRIKRNTYLQKKYVIENKILPYFGQKKIAEIDKADIMMWQNEMMGVRDSEGKGYSDTYLRQMQSQLNAIFNHADQFYDLPRNPANKVPGMGKGKADEMLFWTKDEYDKFSDAIRDKPISFYAFELLYYTGIREGELLALTKADFDLEKRILKIRKSYQRLEKKDVITEPKTEKSKRDIELPVFLCEEMEDFFGMFYKLDNDSRLFDFTKSYLHSEMKRGAKKAGVKKIRIHDLRHSHVAYLIELGFSLLIIADRLGHENTDITERYAHLYPSKQKEIAMKLDERNEENGKNIFTEAPGTPDEAKEKNL